MKEKVKVLIVRMPVKPSHKLRQKLYASDVVYLCFKDPDRQFIKLPYYAGNAQIRTVKIECSDELIEFIRKIVPNSEMEVYNEE